MADRMTAAERAAVSSRIPSRPAIAPAPGPIDYNGRPAEETLHERVAALKLASDLARGDIGPVRRFLRELQNGVSAWQVEPWQLLHELAELQISQQARPAPAPAAESVPVALKPAL
jgi:hypothetical protein